MGSSPKSEKKDSPIPGRDFRKFVPYNTARHHSEFGRSTIDIECPFCGEWVTAYIWSLAGSGKRCPRCKAIHGMYGSRQDAKTNVWEWKESERPKFVHWPIGRENNAD